MLLFKEKRGREVDFSRCGTEHKKTPRQNGRALSNLDTDISSSDKFGNEQGQSRLIPICISAMDKPGAGGTIQQTRHNFELGSGFIFAGLSAQFLKLRTQF